MSDISLCENVYCEEVKNNGENRKELKQVKIYGRLTVCRRFYRVYQK